MFTCKTEGLFVYINTTNIIFGGEVNYRLEKMLSLTIISEVNYRFITSF